MSDRFTPKPLSDRQIDQAFPLIQSILPGIRVEDWRHYAGRLISPSDRRTGIMTVQNRGYIYGLFSYRVDASLQHGSMLMVENFIVLDLFNPSGAAAALLEAMDALADDLGCSAIHTTLPNSEQFTPNYRRWLLSQFRTMGHMVESQTLCKRVAEDELVDTDIPANANDGDGDEGSGRRRTDMAPSV